MKTLKLNNNFEMPVIGLGTYKATEGEVCKIVKEAIDVGYCHFDCAWMYGNEDEIGIALSEKIQDGTVTRDDLFITTKLWNNFHEKNVVVPMLESQLKSLQLDYVDLYLIHWPFGFQKDVVDLWPVNLGSSGYSDIDYLETWQGMEECVQKGLARSIGISNFNSEQITRLLNVAKIKPVVNQIEVNPNVNQKNIIEFCRDRNIVVTGYCPLGRISSAGLPGVPKPTILDEGVLKMQDKYNKTPAQIVLRYLLGLGISVIPKTIRMEKMIENLNVFDFELDKGDVDYLDSLNNNTRICAASDFKDHIYFPFNIEF